MTCSEGFIEFSYFGFMYRYIRAYCSLVNTELQFRKTKDKDEQKELYVSCKVKDEENSLVNETK